MNQSPTTFTFPRLYGWPELRARGINLTNPGLKNLEDREEFPKRTFIGHNTILWDGDAVDRWILQRINEAGSGCRCAECSVKTPKTRRRSRIRPDGVAESYVVAKAAQ